MLNKDDILSKVDLDIKKVKVKEWGGTVGVRGLTARERDQFEASIGSAANLDNLRARLVVLCLVNDEGQRLFEDADAILLGEKNAQVVNKLFDIARNMSGMSDADVNELEGN